MNKIIKYCLISILLMANISVANAYIIRKSNYRPVTVISRTDGPLIIMKGEQSPRNKIVKTKVQKKKPTIAWKNPELALNYARKEVQKYLPHPNCFKEIWSHSVYDPANEYYVVDYKFETPDAYGEIKEYYLQMYIRITLKTYNTLNYYLLDIKDMSE